MKKEELSAAQRIMLAKGQGIYEPKPISISTRTELILFAILELALLAFFFSLLINDVFIKKTNYSTTLAIFVYLVICSYDFKDCWKRYKAEKVKTITA